MLQHEEWVKVIVPVFEVARRYHQHEVHGLDHIPSDHGAILVVNHSLATYDISLLAAAIFIERGLAVRPLIDRLFFKVPFLGDFLVNYFGAVQGSPENAERLLRSGEIITVAPGGMREALRPSSEKYQIRWEKRYGFVRLAMKTRASIVLAACPKADDLYEVFPSHVTAWFYQQYRVPVFLARGIGVTPLPRPVKLVHYLSEAMEPPEWVPDDERESERRAQAFHAKLVERMTRLMREGIASDASR